MSPEQWQAIQSLGTGGLLAFALIGGFRGWYVWGRQYGEMVRERDFWRDVALRSMGHTERAIELAATATKSSDG